MARREDRVDVLNNAIVEAGEMAFRIVQRVVKSQPNPIGMMPERTPKRITMEDIQRMSRGE
jgi:hypothetical protein